jgi:hypothetical protein
VESEFTLEAGYEVREMLLAIALEKSQYQVRQASGLPVVNMRAALRSYFFTNKCSVGPQGDYLGRTVKKARASIGEEAMIKRGVRRTVRLTSEENQRFAEARAPGFKAH